MRFFRKNSHGIAIFKFFRIGDGRVNLNRLVFSLFQLINAIFRSKILVGDMDGAILVYSNVNVWLKLKILTVKLFLVGELLREIGQEQLSVPLDITDYRGNLMTAVVVYEY